MSRKWMVAVGVLTLMGIGAAGSADLHEADALLAEAREAARADLNRKSAALFARVLDAYPTLHDRLVREYADQLLYSGRAGEAIVLFREVLALPGFSKLEGVRARRNLALAYLWSGEHEKAVDAYRVALRDAPGDPDLTRNYVEALIGAARRAAVLDRNRAAADWFADAIHLAPGRRAGLIREYADQLTYSNRAAQAVNLYREIIAGKLLMDPTPSPGLLSSLALALLWSGQPDSARSAFEQVLDMRPEDRDARNNLAEALVVLARRDAAADRNRAAADRLAQALELAPDRRAEWLKEYADQLTYSKRASEAIPLYLEALQSVDLTARARTDTRLSLALARSWAGALDEALADYDALIAEDPKNAPARRGRAEVLAWQEHHAAAATELRTVLEADPDDTAARRQLAWAESHQGRYRKAVMLAGQLLAQDPADEEAAIIAAQARRWMGRLDLAIEALDAFLSVRPENDRALRLKRDMLRDRDARSALGASHTSQSNDVEISRVGVRHSVTLHDGRTQIGPQYRHIRYDPKTGPGVDVERVGGFVRHRFNDAVELNSSLLFDFQDGTRDFTLFTHDTFLTVFPDDFWRIDLGASRTTLDNIRSLNLGLYVDTFSGSVDYWPTGNTKLSARASWSNYSDGNERWWVQSEARQRLIRGPDIWFGARFTAYDFTLQPDNGYFSPNDLQAVESLVEASGSLFGDTTYVLHGTAGYENADPGGGKLVWSAEAVLRQPITDAISLEARASHWASTLGNDSGFRQTTFGLGLGVQW